MIIGTANLHHGVDADGRLRIAEMASSLASLEWDVLAVQELDRFASRSGGTDQHRMLLEECRADGHFASTLSHGGGEYGIGVLWRALTPVSVARRDLPVGNGDEPRVALEVGLQGGPTVAATHLSPNRAAAESGLAELLAPGGAADVIAGDLNLDRGGVMLPEPWSVAGDGEGHATFPVTSPSAWIDHVLYRSDLWRKTGSWTAEIPATDHLAFFAALEPLPPAPAT